MTRCDARRVPKPTSGPLSHRLPNTGNHDVTDVPHPGVGAESLCGDAQAVPIRINRGLSPEMSPKKIGLLAVGAVVLLTAVAGLGAHQEVAAGSDPASTESSAPIASASLDPAAPTPSPSASIATDSPSPAAAASNAPAIQGLTGTVTEVVDGDTIRVKLSTGIERVRIIGIDTPETVDPNRPPACYGAEATAFAKRVLGGKSVILEADPTQDVRDRYDRLLAHVYVSGDLYAAEAIAGGYGIHYFYERPSIHAAELSAAEKTARDAELGIWSACQGRVDLPLAGEVAPTVPVPAAPANPPAPKTAPVAGCHPSYDPCVPDVPYDLDCKDIGHPVTIIGPDVYRLDGRDKDGRGCEG
jgi:endonuclease YncB( thermonuclease family)